MTSTRVLRGLWIAVAGAGIVLGAGNGVAAAETDSTDGPGASSVSGQSTDSSQRSAESASPVAKGVDKGQDSIDAPTPIAKPTSTVSASTVTVDRDDTVTSVPVEQVKTTPTKSPKRSGPAEAAAAEPEESAAKELPTVVEGVAAAPQPAVVDEVSQPAAATVVVPYATVKPAPATETSSSIAAMRSLAAPIAHAPPAGPIATVVISLLSAFGLLPPAPAVPARVVGGPPSTGAVTGVKVGRSDVQIPVGSNTYTGAADWYFPTQADGTVQAQGVMWLQHGFLGSKSWYSALARQLAQQTNSIVVVPNIPSIPVFTCGGCTLSDVATAQGVAALFADPNRAALNLSAGAAGFQGTLPERFTLTGHSAGGGLAAAAGGFYTDAVAPADDDLLGVVMFDGVSSNGTFANAIASLDARGIPVYQIAAPPQPWNANGQTTTDLVALRPGQFVGAVLANGSHVDSLIGGAPIIDFFSQHLIKRSPPGNTQAVYTPATGWINDLYAGRGPNDPLFGSYGEPGQYIVLGETAAVVLGPAPAVAVNPGRPGGEVSSPNRV